MATASASSVACRIPWRGGERLRLLNHDHHILNLKYLNNPVVVSFFCCYNSLSSPVPPHKSLAISCSSIAATHSKNTTNRKQVGTGKKPSLQIHTATPSSNSDSKNKSVVGEKGGKGGGTKHSKAARRFFNDNFREPERLSKVLATAGVASRRGSEEVIFAGRVSVNGVTCNTPQTRVDPFKDSINIDGKSLPKKLPPKLYFALNKPKGYICSSGENCTKSALSLLDPYMKIWIQRNQGASKPRLFTVGRLDVATSGLIIVTNDGEFAQKVAHPSSGLTKEYIVSVEGSVSKKQFRMISEGTVVDGVHCTPVSVEMLEKDEKKERLRVTVCEGRNHEVRHFMSNAGLKILSLKRVRIGDFKLPQDLGLGDYQVISEAAIKKMVGE